MNRPWTGEGGEPKNPKFCREPPKSCAHFWGPPPNPPLILGTLPGLRRLVAHEDDPDSDSDPEIPPDLGALTSILGAPRGPPAEEDETQK